MNKQTPPALIIGTVYELDGLLMRCKKIRNSLGVFQLINEDGTDRTDGTADGIRIVYKNAARLTLNPMQP